MAIKDQLETIKAELHGCALLAVSKFHPVEKIMQAYDAGQRDFGENRVQELMSKQPVLPQDIRWHLIGTLQTNKVKYIAPFIYCIQSVDSIKLLDTIEKEAAKNNRTIKCLLQIYIAKEDTKHGFDADEVLQFFKSGIYKNYTHISFEGLMGMATLTNSQGQIAQEFRKLKSLLTEIQTIANLPHFKELSMGMSSDYNIAIAEGSTMVRLGSSIFGDRL